MAIYRLLKDQPFRPDEIDCMTEAYEATLGVLGLSGRTDAVTEMIAKKIIEIVKTGERDIAAIGARAIAELGLSPFDQY
jgi:hypothetical protein